VRVLRIKSCITLQSCQFPKVLDKDWRLFRLEEEVREMTESAVVSLHSDHLD